MSDELKQEFFDEIEYWDNWEHALVEESESISKLDKPQFVEVIRLGYRVDWTDEDDIQRVQRYYPKFGRDQVAQLTRVTRTKIQRLGFAYTLGIQGNPLSLAPRSMFRRIINAYDQDDFERSTERYVSGVANAATEFSSAHEVRQALKDVLTQIRPLSDDIEPVEHADSMIFTPTELSRSSLLRALEPSFYLGDELGHLPQSRIGTTLLQSLGVSEVLATAERENGIFAIDDLGDGLDAATAQYLATTAINRAGQCWITTRSGAIAEAFEPSEVVRLNLRSDGSRKPHQGWTHETHHDRKLVRNWYRVLAPALSYRAVAVVEGPSDFASLHALGLVLGRKSPKSAPAKHGLAIVSAAEQGSGGDRQVLELSKYATRMGLNAVAAVDGDKSNNNYSNRNWEEYGISVIRLPDGIEIEKAILDNVPFTVISNAVAEICESSGIYDRDIRTVDPTQVVGIATQLIKKNNLHQHIVNDLSDYVVRNLLGRMLDSIIEASEHQVPGFTQL